MTLEPPVESAAMLAGALALKRPVVLVGLMGAGKSSVGRRLARTMSVPFTDADEAISEAAGMSIADIFDAYGEAAFRDLERRVVARLLEQTRGILALGGGAFIDPATRERVKAAAVSVWLRADLATLVARTSRKRGTRPLLKGDDPRSVLMDLIERRHPIYAKADHVFDTGEEPPERIAEAIRTALEASGDYRAGG